MYFMIFVARKREKRNRFPTFNRDKSRNVNVKCFFKTKQIVSLAIFSVRSRDFAIRYEKHDIRTPIRLCLIEHSGRMRDLQTYSHDETHMMKRNYFWGHSHRSLWCNVFFSNRCRSEGGITGSKQLLPPIPIPDPLRLSYKMRLMYDFCRLFVPHHHSPFIPSVSGND